MTLDDVRPHSARIGVVRCHALASLSDARSPVPFPAESPSAPVDRTVGLRHFNSSASPGTRHDRTVISASSQLTMGQAGAQPSSPNGRGLELESVVDEHLRAQKPNVLSPRMPCFSFIGLRILVGS